MGHLSQLFHLVLILRHTHPVKSECSLVKHGLSSDLLFTGATILTPHGALPDSSLYIHAGKITHVGDLCDLGTRASPDASILHCPHSIISPGFINTHEHIDFSTFRPLPDLRERVNHRHDWRVGSRNATLREVSVNGTALAATRWGELRHLFSGTTSLIGKEMVPGLVRNLDYIDGLESLLVGPIANYDVFPLADHTGVQRTGDCDYGANAIDRESVVHHHRYIGHVAEGVDAEAANEFTCLSNATFDTIPFPGGGGGGLSTDIIGPNVALVHALGLTPADIKTVADRGAKVVWSPRSNVFLYGKTLDITALLRENITVALGTDWLPSGSATMAREAICGAYISQKSYNISLPPKTLWEMATINAAKVAGFEDSLGSLEIGKLADIVVFSSSSSSSPSSPFPLNSSFSDPYAQAIFAPQSTIELVLRSGQLLLANAPLSPLTRRGAHCELIAFEHADKIACVADELGASFADFEASLGGVYPAVLPAVPPDEPTCEPTR